MKALYKYPQNEFPYELLVQENRMRGRELAEFELLETGIFDNNRYFDIYTEYAKASPNDILIKVHAYNRGSEEAPLFMLPTIWFRNSWSWGRSGEGHWPKPILKLLKDGTIQADHSSLGRFFLAADSHENFKRFLFTDNETNRQKLFDMPNETPYVKDGFHNYLINGQHDAVNPSNRGTKAALLYHFQIPGNESRCIQLRLFAEELSPSGKSALSIESTPKRDGYTSTTRFFGQLFNETFSQRMEEADEYHASIVPSDLDEEEQRLVRQGNAGLLWTKQFYHNSVSEWLEGDPVQSKPTLSKLRILNSDWKHLYNRDVISMPDKWEYPWYAAWDLAFHMIPFSRIDPHYTKEQLILMLREWYMHPNGQLPAYEWAFSDVNPPVHAWAVWRVFKMTAKCDERDHVFLARAFQKLLLNFTWWVNRKDPEGNNVFAGGFLGLDNIGVFDRSQPLPTGGYLEQADGTSWMAFYCATMLSIALELARKDPAYEDVASKFFEHFIAIADAMNRLHGYGLWDEEDGFYYDHIHLGYQTIPLKVRSLVGLLPLIAVEILEDETIDRLPGFKKRMNWFLENRPDLSQTISCMEVGVCEGSLHRRILAIPSVDKLRRLLEYLFDEGEFLSPFGIRSLSRVHRERPYTFTVDSREYRVEYTPGESNTAMFGGNSNWRGPVWFPMNYLIIEALERYHHFFGNTLMVEFPTGSGRKLNLQDAASTLSARLVRLFLPDEDGRRPCNGDVPQFKDDPLWRNNILFYEYFHGDSGRGLGASHQTGWTALVVKLVENLRRGS